MVVGHEHADTQCPSNRTTVNLRTARPEGSAAAARCAAKGSRSFSRRGTGGPPVAAD